MSHCAQTALAEACWSPSGHRKGGNGRSSLGRRNNPILASDIIPQRKSQRLSTREDIPCSILFKRMAGSTKENGTITSSVLFFIGKYFPLSDYLGFG